MIIRQASKEDVHQIVPLMISYIVDFFKRTNPGAPAVQNLVTHLIDHPEQGIQLIAVDEETIIGFATLYFTFSSLQAKRAAVLNDLFVQQSARGKKVGEALFFNCLKYIRDNSFAYMQWETDKDNYVAQSLYNKMGGHISDRLIYEIE